MVPSSAERMVTSKKRLMRYLNLNILGNPRQNDALLSVGLSGDARHQHMTPSRSSVSLSAMAYKPPAFPQAPLPTLITGPTLLVGIVSLARPALIPLPCPLVATPQLRTPKPPALFLARLPPLRQPHQLNHRHPTASVSLPKSPT